MSSIEFLADERTALTPLADAHVETMTRWVNNQSVIRYLGGPLGISVDEERKWLERIRASQDDVIYGIMIRESGQLIGTVALHGVRGLGRHAEYGISIGEPEHWGKGYGFEACRLMLDWGFNRLNLHSVYLRVFADNQRGVRSYEKAGFKHAGMLRQHAFRDGVYLDMYYMDILREEFNSQWADWRARQAERYAV
ncbi:GNAT family N-acetyltransferase [bacterium]|nr:GNAT family N-acetyltransferase [bacterium]